VLLVEPGAAHDEGEELGLVIGHRCLALELDQFAERIAAQRWPEPLVNQLVECLLGRRVVVLFNEGEPLRGVTRHVEGSQENFAGVFSALDAEELLTTIQLGQRILRTIVHGEKQPMTMASSRNDRISGGASARGAIGLKLVGLKAVHIDIEL
jgi:hypothetical protein